MSDQRKNKKQVTLLLIGLLGIGLVLTLWIVKQYKDQGKEILGEQQEKTGLVDTKPVVNGFNGTFSYDSNLSICKKDEKVVVYLFSTTWCPHCIWIKDTFDKVVKEYMEAGKIAAYHYELDTKDNTLTPGKENLVPQEAIDIFNRFNPDGSIPTFVIGCKYWRVGNGFEASGDLAAEEEELRRLIEKVISEK